MNKKTWTVVAIVLVVVLIGIVALMMMQQPSTPTNTTPDQTNEGINNTDGQPTQNGEAAQTGAVAVAIQSFAFAPQSLTVKKGTTVTWTNNDDVAHTVTADVGVTGGPDSKLLAKNETYEFTFNQTGTFGYHCKPHPQMKGTVTVVD